jgi:hypothetical protein
MPNLSNFVPGDFLVLQIESGYALLRLLDVEEESGETLWHIRAYSDLYLEIDQAETAVATPEKLRVVIAHVAMTDRAFLSTQVAKLSNAPLTTEESADLNAWRESADREVSDRSIRLLMGLR